MRGRGRGGRGSSSSGGNGFNSGHSNGGNTGFNSDNQSGFNDNQSSFGGSVSTKFPGSLINEYLWLSDFKNQLRILVPETDFLEIIAAGDLTVIHAVAASINQEDSISNEINSNRHFPVIKMTTTIQFNVVVVAVEVAVISTPVVVAEAASTIQEAALIILVVTADLTIRVVVSTILVKAVSIN